jgi:hypothetical protein
MTLFAAVVASIAVATAAPPAVEIVDRQGQLDVTVGGAPFVTWSPGDDTIHRPHLFDLHIPGGVTVTRNHPPKKGADPTDHADMHPGVWLAFGDLSGRDFWRNKGPVVSSRVTEPPKGGDGRGTFTTTSDYTDGDRLVCRETCRYVVSVRPAGALLVIDSTFSNDDGEGFSFGDQEEMGLGVRVATPLSVKSGGWIHDSVGRVNEKAVWGQAADWCDYGGTIDGKDAGVMLIPHPDNFRRSRFHARDYGLLVANPFAIKAFGAGEPSRVVVRKGSSLRLRFGVLARTCPGTPEALREAYEDSLREMGKECVGEPVHSRTRSGARRANVAWCETYYSGNRPVSVIAASGGRRYYSRTDVLRCPCLGVAIWLNR